MEKLVILNYGNFSILGRQVRQYAQRTGCSNGVVDQILWGQLFLDKLFREHSHWTTTQKQEWGLFQLECLLHNVATMHKREHQRYSQGPKSEMTKLAPEHPPVWTLLAPLMQKFWRWQNRFTRENSQLPPVYSPKCNRVCVWGSCASNSTGTWLGLASRVRSEWPNPPWEAEDDFAIIPPQEPVPPQLDLGGQKWPNN